MTVTEADETARNEAPSSVASVGVPTAPKRNRNMPWIIAGSVLVLLGALGAVTLARSLTSRVDIVVAARDIERDQPITAADLTTVSISGGDGAKAIAAERIPSLIGQVATSDIASGSILHPDILVEASAVDPRQVVLGLDLDPGAYPTTGILPGDNVLIVVIGETISNTEATVSSVLTEGEIVTVQSLTPPDQLLVSVLVDERFASAISSAAFQGRIRLALLDEVGSSSSLSPEAETDDGPADEAADDSVDDVTPLEPSSPADPADPADPPAVPPVSSVAPTQPPTTQPAPTTTPAPTSTVPATTAPPTTATP